MRGYIPIAVWSEILISLVDLDFTAKSNRESGEQFANRLWVNNNK